MSPSLHRDRKNKEKKGKGKGSIKRRSGNESSSEESHFDPDNNNCSTKFNTVLQNLFDQDCDGAIQNQPERRSVRYEVHGAISDEPELSVQKYIQEHRSKPETESVGSEKEDVALTMLNI